MGITITSPRIRGGVSRIKVIDNPDAATNVVRIGKKVSNWAVGITIAPRERPTHDITIDSFVEAGWESLHIFAEPDVVIDEKHSHFPITKRNRKFGAWQNWFTALKNLVDFYPEADCYGIIQDDVIFCKGVKKFLEKTLWPAPDVGVCSVFTPSHYTNEVAGWYKNNRGGKLWMAQTYFFPPEGAISCLNHPRCVKWKKDRQIDNAVGFWSRSTKMYPYYFSPSLAQHIGHASTLWSKGNKANGRRSASDFVGQDYDIGHGL